MGSVPHQRRGEDGGGGWGGVNRQTCACELDPLLIQEVARARARRAARAPFDEAQSSYPEWPRRKRVRRARLKVERSSEPNAVHRQHRGPIKAKHESKRLHRPLNYARIADHPGFRGASDRRKKLGFGGGATKKILPSGKTLALRAGVGTGRRMQLNFGGGE